MVNLTGVKLGIDLGVIIKTTQKNGYNLTATARELGCTRANVRRRLTNAILAGDHRIDPHKLFGPKVQMSRPLEEIIKAREELGLRNDRKVAKGDWTKPKLIPLPDGPIILGIFGDPHLDNSGCDLDMFEDELSRRDPDQGVYTCCVGDFFDNWPRAMGHLYAESGDPAPAWVLFEHWMENYPFLFSVTGNHDLFVNGTENFLDVFFRQHGMVLRRSGGRFLLGTQNPITISMRHIWQGNSQYSNAHNLKRAATFGHTDDDVIIGGHFHKGECRTHVRPSDGKVSKLIAVSSFKRLDNFANDKGLMSAATPPFVWCVLDARESVTSHNRVQPFYDFSAARAMLEHQRAKNHF